MPAPMTSSRILFKDWKPDQPAHLSDGLTVADGCIPIADGYAPMGKFSAVNNGQLAGRCYGASAYRTNGATYVFAATSTAIYRYTSAGYNSLATGLDNSLGLRFCPYASLMLATNGIDGIRKFDPTASSSMTALGGSPPVARYIAVVGGFTVLGYASNSSTRVAWSDQGNPENWTPGGSSEAGVYDMASGGDITGMVGGEYGLVFQENRIVRMDYTATDTVWQFNEIATDIGCIIPGTIATWGKMTFFLSNRGFMVCDGTTVTPIGNEKFDRWYLSRADRSYYGSTSAVIDPMRSLYLVTVPSGLPANVMLLYSYTLQRQTTVSTPIEYIAPGYAQSVTLEDLDAIYGTLDSIPVSLDSDIFRGGAPFLLVFNDQHKLGSFGGDPMDATLTDALREYSTGRRARLRSCRPITDAAAPSVTIAGTNAFSSALTPTNYSSVRANGTIPLRESWNLSQVTISIPSQRWNYVQGCDLEVEQGGRA
jgi:hypothetical protein